MAPTTVDGLDIDDATIDGDVVDEITMDGDVVYQASAIPDSEDLHARYAADELSLSDGDPVGTWPDESGNGYNLTEGDAPTYRANVGGMPAVEFNDTSNWLDTQWATLSQPYDIYLVFEITNGSLASSTQRIYDAAENGNRSSFGTSTDDEWFLQGENVVRGSTPDEQQYIASTLWNDPNSVIRLNGVQDVSGDAGAGDLDGFMLNASSSDLSAHQGMYVREVLVYETSVNETSVEDYLERWQ